MFAEATGLGYPPWCSGPSGRERDGISAIESIWFVFWRKALWGLGLGLGLGVAYGTLVYERRARPDVMGAGARSQGGEDTPALGRYCMSRPSSAHMPSAPTNTTFSRTCRMSPSKSLRPGPPGRGIT